jgi:hypothetical protein
MVAIYWGKSLEVIILSSACMRKSSIKPVNMHICINQREILSFSMRSWSSPSRRKTRIKVNSFLLASVLPVPLSAAKIRAETLVSLSSGPTRKLNQVAILYSVPATNTVTAM